MGGGGSIFSINRLMGMCHWMGSHFHDWIDYNGVAFSIELLGWGHSFWDFGSQKEFTNGKVLTALTLTNLSIILFKTT